MQNNTMTFPFETIKISRIDHFCEEIAVVVYDAPDGTSRVKICRTDEALRRVRAGDTVACSELGAQWSIEYTDEALKDYHATDKMTRTMNAILAAATKQWCVDRGINFADFSLALSAFLCDRRTDVLMCELSKRRRKAQLEAEKMRKEARDDK